MTNQGSEPTEEATMIRHDYTTAWLERVARYQAACAFGATGSFMIAAGALWAGWDELAYIGVMSLAGFLGLCSTLALRYLGRNVRWLK